MPGVKYLGNKLLQISASRRIDNNNNDKRGFS